MPSPQQVLVAIGICALVADGFQAPIRPAATKNTSPFVSQSAASTSLYMAKKGGKGFGESKAPPENKSAVETAPAATTTSSAAAASTTDYDKAADLATPLTTTPDEPALNSGQAALARMRAQRQTKKDAELRRIAEIRQMDAQVQEEAAAIPERVAQRMGKRMLPFVGIPLFGGMGAFVAFWYFATYRGVEFEPVVVAGTTIGLLAVSLLVSC